MTNTKQLAVIFFIIWSIFPRRYPDGIFDATKSKAIRCHAPAPPGVEPEFTEDCLVLNIFKKEEVKSKQHEKHLRKVHVHIHGGAYIGGTSYLWTPISFVLSHDIVVVMINYRLGVLGFLSTENNASPGNFGLWDQRLALIWVKNNIQAFGGNPNDITISGNSAGGSSVGYLTLSPHSNDLFSKAILQSGTPTSVFGLSLNPQSEAIAVSTHVGCVNKTWANENLDIEQSQEIVDCLRKTPVERIMSLPNHSNFVPTVDKDFVPDVPLKLLQDDSYLESVKFFDKSFLVSLVNNEAGIMDLLLSAQATKRYIFNNDEITREEKQQSWTEFIQSKIAIMAERRTLFADNSKQRGDVVQKINEFYSRRYDNYTAMIQTTTDLNFLLPSIDFLSACARSTNCNSYFIYFDYYPRYMNGSLKGLDHAMDLMYFFDVELSWLAKVLQIEVQGEFSQEDEQFKTIYSSIISEFTRTGDPSVALQGILEDEWPKFNTKTSPFLRLSSRPWVDYWLDRDKQLFWLEGIPGLLSDIPRHDEL